MTLKDLEFRTEYRSGLHNLITEFYQPALVRSNTYLRAVGYFSSSVLEAVGKPLRDFVSNKGCMRLVTSVELSEKDVDAINRGMAKHKVVEEKISDDVPSIVGG